MKEFTRMEKATIKRIAASEKPLRNKLNKINEKIALLEGDAELIKAQIDTLEIPVKAITGGYDSETVIKNNFEITEINDTEFKEAELPTMEETPLESLNGPRAMEGDEIANPSFE